MVWIGWILLAACLRGIADPISKTSLRHYRPEESLLVLTLFNGLWGISMVTGAPLPATWGIWVIATKSLIMATAWLLFFYSLSHLNLSLSVALQLLSGFFGMLLGYFALNEHFTLPQTVGVMLLLGGLIATTCSNQSSSSQPPHDCLKSPENKQRRAFGCAVLASFLSATSLALDRILLQQGYEVSSIQGWFYLFMVPSAVLLFFLLRPSRTSQNLHGKPATLSWIALTGLLFILSDRAFLLGAQHPDAYLGLLVPLKRTSIMVSLGIGIRYFGEQKALEKFAAASVMLLGVALIAYR